MRYIKMLAVLLLGIFVFASCAAKQKPIDCQQLSDELFAEVPFQDELTLADEKTAEKLYNIQNAVKEFVYIGSGATAEEIAVFEFATEEEAKNAVENAKTRISDQTDSFASYVPKETEKLDNAVVRQSGNYLVVCVSDGDKAEEIIGKYFA